VWQTGDAARRVSATDPQWQEEYRRVLPDFRESDVSGSCFAVQDYHVHVDFGGDDAAVRAQTPGFLFLAEVYWDLEWTLQQQGFDYTYDKRLYGRLVDGAARPAREHLLAGLDFQDHLARFLENHDEPRAAATFPFDVHRAAAVITFLGPGLRFLHQGQREGRRVRIPMHLGRGPEEPLGAALHGRPPLDAEAPGPWRSRRRWPAGP
jgi:hypothetical protein